MTGTKLLKIQRIGFQWEMEDPFLFCAHHNDSFPAGNDLMGPAVSLVGRNIGSDFSAKDGFSMYHGDVVPGFPVHPHRGFETVTIALKGLIDHFDSKGATGRYGEGDVQWMTAGAGCQHSEMFPLLRKDKPNPAELFQVWLNLPSSKKFADPAYKMLWSEDIPTVTVPSKNGNCYLRIIAGSYGTTLSLEPCPDSWAADRNNKVGIMLIRMEAGAELTLPRLSSTAIRNLYFYEGKGSLTVEGQSIAASHRLKLAADAEVEITNEEHESLLLLLEGEPIMEPVVQYGPFVMNTEAEIRQTFSDYRATEFGGWPWDRRDPVHHREAGRLARYSDGTEEFRP